ncbi:MAG: hypothetical protein SGILL_000142 [Bacillariaceae sp.]
MTILLTVKSALLLVAALLRIGSTIATSAPYPPPREDKHLQQAKAVFEWVAQSEGSIVHPKQEVRRAIPSDISSPLGVYATEDIEEGEILTHVSWDNIITVGLPEDHGEQLPCGLVVKLTEELKLGKDSNFAPYVEYLNDEADGQIPSSWSKDGRDVFLEVVEKEIPPLTQLDWFEEARTYCKLDAAIDPFIRKAILLIIQRSDDDIMIPAYDSYNHRNGNFTNTQVHCETGEYHQVKARYRIPRGDQILLSYNQCDECGGRSHFYGTAEMLRDYGFVEYFPQRWHFTSEYYHFDLGYYDDDKNITLIWDDEYHPPRDDEEELQETVEWFQAEIERLQKLRPTLERNDKGVDSHELSTVLEFLDANVFAMRMAVESLKDHMAWMDEEGWPQDSDDEDAEEDDSDTDDEGESEDAGGDGLPGEAETEL